ncbi:hypothetical protein E4U17_003792 [Claviceps sp. LM77 group G4]|nr:hypothetical protein E4U17_003792 [Claviceps sp. LM77 group G4]KAG6071216.1 hypothetical protein E4U33_003828 [Claviceps sp. LM78 group G4]KAG6074377.1 hypothetical protein E4U16_003997 [Claviceps sp. LM84 group G4]
MEPSQVGVTVDTMPLDSCQKFSDSVGRNNDDEIADQSTCRQNSRESESKIKRDSPNCGSANSRKPKDLDKRGSSGKDDKLNKTRKSHRLERLDDVLSSDSELDSSTESNVSSSSEADEDTDLSPPDKDKGFGSCKSERSRNPRSCSRRHMGDSLNALERVNKAVHVTKDSPSRQKEQHPSKRTDAISQQDTMQALAKLELHCSQLQHRLDSLSVYQAPQTNGVFAIQQQPVISPLQPVVSRPCNTADSTQSIHRPDAGSGDDTRTKISEPESSHHAKNKAKLEYKRVDAVWDSKLYAFKLQDTAKVASDSKYAGYLFHVRRTFHADGRYRASFVDIKSQLLRECLQDVIGNVRGVNLVDELPKLDPNLLFLYLEDLRSHCRNLKKVEPAGRHRRERRKNQRRLDNKRMELKVLIKYLDKDYAKVKKSLYPMLDSGIISFEYLWALWKPNTLVFSGTYGQTEDPRVFKLDMAARRSSPFQGDFYVVEGKYLEFDGKRFGLGSITEEIADFHGTRKISSLPFYPLSYHKDEPKMRQMLIERGKKFVSLGGIYLKEYSGLAYMKRKKGAVMKFHLQPSRIMVDPVIFRRTNPNYSVSAVRPKDFDSLSDSELSDDEGDVDEVDGLCSLEGIGTELASSRNGENVHCVVITKALQHDINAKGNSLLALKSLPTTFTTTVRGATGVDAPADDTVTDPTLLFRDDDYLLASPVVLGFSFSEKQWLEFSVSRIGEIRWNEDAWGSLVLPQETKDLIKALVMSRKYNLSQTIDDVIQGKGKGLVSVLHGPPGTGKTLTAEGISELLQCPLYMASAGELGTNPTTLEHELQKILDICHSWGAILLLDEADVFLEKRNMQDIHRNALVSIFLRQLEYFQGILFLTTNRVEAFDEAFQSRIHIALRYEGLDLKAKKAIFNMFIARIEAHGKLRVEPFTDEDLTQLAKHDLNGREIKNMIASAQDLALSRAETLSVRHMQQVLDIHHKFGRDLRGGSGYEDAMRSYS